MVGNPRAVACFSLRCGRGMGARVERRPLGAAAVPGRGVPMAISGVLGGVLNLISCGLLPPGMVKSWGLLRSVRSWGLLGLVPGERPTVVLSEGAGRVWGFVDL